MARHLKDVRVQGADSSIGKWWLTVWSGFDGDDIIHVDTFANNGGKRSSATAKLTPDQAVELAEVLLRAARNAKLEG